MTTPDRKTPPEVRPLPKLLLPQQREITLDNSVKVIYLPDIDKSGVFEMMWLSDGGIAESSNPHASLSAFKLLSEGCGNLSAADTAEILDMSGASVSHFASAHFTQASVRGLISTAGKVLDTASRFLSNPTFEQQSVDMLKQNMIASIKIADRKVKTQAAKTFDRMIWGAGHPCAFNPDCDGIEALSRNDLLNAHRELYSPSRSAIYLSGGITDQFLQLLNSTIGALPADGFPGKDIVVTPPRLEETLTCEIKMNDAKQSAVAAGLHTISRSHPDYEHLRLTILALGGYFSSRLMLNLREEKGLTYGISAGLEGRLDGGVIKIACECNSDNTDIVIDEIRNEIRRLASNPPEGEELTRLKLFASTRLAESYDSVWAIVKMWSLQRLVGLSSDHYNVQREAIASLTPEIISRMTLKYLDPDLLSVAMARP